MPGVVKARDAMRQLLPFMGAYGAYEIVRGLAARTGRAPFVNAGHVIDFEKALHVFVEPAIHRWTEPHHALIVLADWTYVNAHIVITLGVLAFLYARHADRFVSTRNTFMIA